MSSWSPDKDTLSNALKIVDHITSEVHDGHSFRCGQLLTTVSSGASRLILMKIPNVSTYVHWGSEDTSNVACQFSLYEGSTYKGVSKGTTVTAYNNNRCCSHVATVSVYHTPTISSLGTAIMQKQWGSGKTEGGTTGTAAEIILKNNTNYIFKIINKASPGTLTGYWQHIWIEHDVE